MPAMIDPQPHWIGGREVAGEATETIPVFNPATGEVLAMTPLGGAAEVEQAVAAAHAAFPAWRATPVGDRIQPLFRLKALLETHFEDLARQVTCEHGKTLAEARGSVRRGIQMVESACAMPVLMQGLASEDIASGIDCQTIRRPLGVCAAIAPFNFPAMVPMWFWPFALAAGNTFVLKPSERVPLTAMRIAELLAEAGLPPGVFNIVHGGKAAADALLVHPDIRAVSFVGSTPVASHVYTTAAAAGKRVQALGGAKNFMVVLPDAALEQAASVALESIIGCAGERCLAGSLVVSVGDRTAAEIRRMMTERARRVRVGNGLDPATDMGPLISPAARRRVENLIAGALEQGAELVLDGRYPAAPMDSCFLAPTVLAGITAEMTIAQEEVFGPVVLLAQAQTLDEAIAWINRCPLANTTTLFTSHGAAARRFCHEVAPTMIGINIGVPAPLSYYSFGGSRRSFFGDLRAHGREGAMFYTESVVTITRWLKSGSIW